MATWYYYTRSCKIFVCCLLEVDNEKEVKKLLRR